MTFMHFRVTSGQFIYMCFGSEAVITLQDLIGGRRELTRRRGLAILQNKSLSASSAIASIVYNLLQKHI